MKNNILSNYKKLTAYDKNNLDNYLIVKGIVTVSPSLSEEEALFLFDMCKIICVIYKHLCIDTICVIRNF